MGNAQQMHYVENKRQFELAQNKILNRLNEQGYFEHNGLACWNNPLNDDTEPEAFRPQWLEEEYHIIFNKKAGEYCVIGDDEKMQRERKREYQGKRIAQYLANRACADHSGEKTVWLDVTGCVKRGHPWVRKLADDPQMLARLTMLSCHLHYNKHKLMKLRTYGHESMRRRDARSLLALNNKTFQDFWSEHLDRILTMSGEQLLIGNGSVSHKQAIDKATGEYRKYKARTLSEVERDYLDSIKLLEQKTDKK